MKTNPTIIENYHSPTIKGSLHLGKHISHDTSLLVLSNIGELRPGQGMIKVVLHLVVLRQAEQVTMLHVQQVLRLGRGRVDNPSMFPSGKQTVKLTWACLTFIVDDWSWRAVLPQCVLNSAHQEAEYVAAGAQE